VVSKKKLLILGTRTFAVEVADLAGDTEYLQIAGFVENINPDRCKENLDGKPVVWVDDLDGMAKSHVAVCGLATTTRKVFTDQVAGFGIPFTRLIHPTARISNTSSIGAGSILSVGVVVASHTQIGEHVCINRGALIGHHNQIGNYVTIQPGVNMAGLCKIEDQVFIGIGAVVMDRIHIGRQSVVGAGALVTKDVPKNVQVMGIPARIVKENVVGR